MSVDKQEFSEFLGKEQEGIHEHAYVADREITKTLNFVAGGAFALSVTFYLNTELQFRGLWLLIISWALLILAVVFNVVGYHLQRRWADNSKVEIRKMRDPETPRVQPSDWNKYIAEESKTKDPWLARLNDLAVTFFIGGIVLLAWFTILNVLYKNQVGKPIQKFESTVHFEKTGDASVQTNY